MTDEKFEKELSAEYRDWVGSECQNYVPAFDEVQRLVGVTVGLRAKVAELEGSWKCFHCGESFVDDRTELAALREFAKKVRAASQNCCTFEGVFAYIGHALTKLDAKVPR